MGYIYIYWTCGDVYRARCSDSHSCIYAVLSFGLQEVSELPEGEAYEFRLMSGEVIRLEQDGSHYLDDHECSGDSYKGVEYC